MIMPISTVSFKAKLNLDARKPDSRLSKMDFETIETLFAEKTKKDDTFELKLLQDCGGIGLFELHDPNKVMKHPLNYPGQWHCYPHNSSSPEKIADEFVTIFNELKNKS